MHKPSSQEGVTSLHDLSAVDLIAGFQAKQFSPSEVLEDVLAHIAVWEPHIKALYAFDPDGARAVAKASTERWQKGEPIGPLDGVPATIKENIATKGVPVPLGAATSKLVPAAADAPPAARLREAGAVIFSKTTMPDYGMLSSGLSSFHPLTRNPWDLSKNPGGSSAGAGAAGAAGYGPLHLGTDIGGSVRLPACWCGLVALKPSLGRDPDRPALCRPRRRTDDPHRRRRRADDERAVAARSPRRHEPAARQHQLESARQVRAQIAARPDARSPAPARRWSTEVREVAVKAAQRVRGGGRRSSPKCRHPDPRNARWARQFLARADVGRSFQARRGRAGQGAALYLHMGGNRRQAVRRRRHPGLQCHHGDPRRGGKAVLRSRLRDLAGIAGGEFRRRTRRPDQRSRQAVRTHRLYRAVEYVGKPGRLDQWRLQCQAVFRSASRSSAAASTISACSEWPRRSRACAVRSGRGPVRRK